MITLDLTVLVSITVLITALVGGLAWIRSWVRNIAVQVTGQLSTGDGHTVGEGLDGVRAEVGGVRTAVDGLDSKVSALAVDVGAARSTAEHAARRLDDHIAHHPTRWRR